jgi:phage terminase large subunit-like protein
MTLDTSFAGIPDEELSLAERISVLPPEERAVILDGFDEDTLEALQWDWRFWGRPKQHSPEGSWSTWLILAGRGWGKTRTGAEWIKEVVCGKTPLAPGRYHRIAIVGETAADVRDVIVEGNSGIMSVFPKDFMPKYEPSKRRLTWPNGAIATCYNAIEPDQLRGPQHDAAWCDEMAKWRYVQETWDNLQFGLRLGTDPKQVITTTPRPLPILRQLIHDPNTVVTKGSMYENRSNLSQKFLDQAKAKYEGTRLGRQEIDAEILDDSPDALWQRSKIDEQRITVKGGKPFYAGREFKLPDMRRIVVAIDPAIGTGGKGTVPEGAETGIIVAGLGVDGRGYVLQDVSCGLDPGGWGLRAVKAYDEYEADVIVGEINQGGEMVGYVIRSIRNSIPFKPVHASRGKSVRAEPVAALYQQGRISHVGAFPQLEDQMVLFTPFGIDGIETADRTDALVWALTALFPHIVNFKDKEPAKDAIRPDRWRSAFARKDRSGSDNNWKVT